MWFPVGANVDLYWTPHFLLWPQQSFIAPNSALWDSAEWKPLAHDRLLKNQRMWSWCLLAKHEQFFLAVAIIISNISLQGDLRFSQYFRNVVPFLLTVEFWDWYDYDYPHFSDEQMEHESCSLKWRPYVTQPVSLSGKTGTRFSLALGSAH